jgi:hypothetical protein
MIDWERAMEPIVGLGVMKADEYDAVSAVKKRLIFIVFVKIDAGVLGVYFSGGFHGEDHVRRCVEGCDTDVTRVNSRDAF